MNDHGMLLQDQLFQSNTKFVSLEEVWIPDYDNGQMLSGRLLSKSKLCQISCIVYEKDLQIENITQRRQTECISKFEDFL